MLNILLPILGKLILGGLDWWLGKQAQDAEMHKAYMAFLTILDKKGAAKVGQYIHAEKARKALADKIRKERMGAKKK